MKQSILFFFLIVLLSSSGLSQNVIGSTGDVGIGISPATTLHVFKNVSGNTNPLLILQDDLTTGSTHLQFKGTGRLFNMGVGNDSEATLGVANKFYIYDHTAGASRFVIDAVGNIGIGTTTPAPLGTYLTTIDIRGASGGGIYTGTTSSTHGFFYSWSDQDVYAGSTTGNFRLFSNSIERMTITSDGDVGIGMIPSLAKLQVAGAIRAHFGSNGSSLVLVGSGSNLQFNHDGTGNVSLYNSAGGAGIKFNVWNGSSETTGLYINSSANVGIGTLNPQAKLAVKGNLFAEKVKVTLAPVDWPDYVFSKSYKLLPLLELEKFIEENSHLPEIPSAREVESNGLDLGDNQAKLLKKIEELTLYLIDQNKRIEEMNKKFIGQKKDN